MDNTKPRVVLVVKRRKPKLSTNTRTTIERKPTCDRPWGLPRATRTRSSSRLSETSPRKMDNNQLLMDGVVDPEQKGDDSFPGDLHDSEDEFVQNLPSDTMLVFQNLLVNRAISIPVQHCEEPNAMIPAVLDAFLPPNEELNAHLYKDILPLLSTASRHEVTSSSIRVYIRLTDYQRAVRAILPPSQSWFVDHVGDYKSTRISKQFFQKYYHGNDISSALKSLVQHEVILPISSEDDCYQLWLPKWPLVIKAFREASQKVMSCLKRSYQKERSLSALRQPYSPISTSLVVDWLVFNGHVAKVERPSGTFVKLV